MHANPSDIVKLFILAAVWGASFLCIEIALRGFTPFSIAALRIVLGASALLALARLRRPLAGGAARLAAAGHRRLPEQRDPVFF